VVARASPVEGDRQGGPAVDKGGEGDGHEALVLECIMGNLWKSFMKCTSVVSLHCEGHQDSKLDWIPKKIPKSTTSCDMFDSNG
jgi:hypothetical protein